MIYWSQSLKLALYSTFNMIMLWAVLFYFTPPPGMQSIAKSALMSQTSQNLSAGVNCGYSSASWWRCNTLCASSFVDVCTYRPTCHPSQRRMHSSTMGAVEALRTPVTWRWDGCSEKTCQDRLTGADFLKTRCSNVLPVSHQHCTQDSTIWPFGAVRYFVHYY